MQLFPSQYLWPLLISSVLAHTSIISSVVSSHIKVTLWWPAGHEFKSQDLQRGQDLQPLAFQALWLGCILIASHKCKSINVKLYGRAIKFTHISITLPRTLAVRCLFCIFSYERHTSYILYILEKPCKVPAINKTDFSIDLLSNNSACVPKFQVVTPWHTKPDCQGKEWGV